MERSGTSALGVPLPPFSRIFSGGVEPRPYAHSNVPCERPLPLPLGEVAERSEDGEGKPYQPSQSPTVTALPEGEPRVCAPLHRRIPPGGGFQRGGPQPSPFGRFKERGSLRGEGNRNPSPLKPFFGYFLSGKKVPRRRQKKKEVRGGQSRPPLRFAYRWSVRIHSGGCGRPPLRTS